MNSKNKKSSGFASLSDKKPVSDSTLSAANSDKKNSSSLAQLLNTEHVCKISKMAVGGAGVAKIPFLDRQVTVFVDTAVVNDEIKIKISAAEKNYLLGDVVQLIQPSSFRTEPLCSYFYECGGCSWQHIKYEQQVQFKEEMLADLFKKFLPEQTFSLTASVLSEKPYYYRNRIQLKHLDGQLGYFKRRSNDIVPIEKCVIADEKINAEIEKIKKSIRPKKEIQKFELKINTDGHFEHHPIGQSGEGLAFAQVNQSVNEKLVQKTLALVKKISPTTITELYSGAGNFTLPLAAQHPQTAIEAVEFNSELTGSLKKMAQQQKVQKQLTVFTTKCETFATRRLLSKDLVLLDPPRSGCDPTVIKKIASQKPQHVIYISCNPAALVRDLDLLFKSEKKYHLRDLQIFDMFPQTDHFETFVWLEKTE